MLLLNALRPLYVCAGTSTGLRRWGSAAAGAAPLKAAKAVFLELAEAELPATDATEGVEAVFATDLLAAMAPGALQGAVAEWRRWSGIDAAALPDSELSFRVTVDKVIDFSDSANKKYGFSSQQAAGWLGFGVGAATRWKVDLKHYRLHLLCLLYRRRLRLGLALTDTEASNARNRAAFGRTSLQVQVAHCMARMARPAAGEVLLDLFCGTGIIPIEAEQHCPHILALGSDVDPEETERAGQNVRFAGAIAGVLTADASRLPLRDASVTKIVSDMPWGRRCGGYVGNTALYPKFLREARRVIQPGGDMFLLTLEKGIIRRYLGSDEARWSLVRAYHVRNGFDVVLLHLKPD